LTQTRRFLPRNGLFAVIKDLSTGSRLTNVLDNHADFWRIEVETLSVRGS
jgi:hypothetical protein